MSTDQSLLDELTALTQSADDSNLGDAILRAIDLKSRIVDSSLRETAALPLSQLRGFAARAVFGWKLFANPPTVPKPLEDNQVLQLIAIESALRELEFACESLDYTSAITWGGSIPIRFYLNSIYHYVSSMFLIDTSSPKQKHLPMGGSVVRALHPMGLSSLLDPIQRALREPFSQETTLGDTILHLRHSYLVHGDFSFRKMEYLVTQTQMREPSNQVRFASLIWDLYYQIIVLRLRIVSLFAEANISVENVMLRYISSLKAS